MKITLNERSLSMEVESINGVINSSKFLNQIVCHFCGDMPVLIKLRDNEGP